MNLADSNSNTYMEFDAENYDNDPKSKIGDHVRISRYKNFFGNGYTPNWIEKVFVIKTLKMLYRRHNRRP